MKRFALGTTAAAMLAISSYLGAAPALAQGAPAEQGKGIVLTEPGVVFVSTSVAVDVKLTYASDSTISGVDTFSASYETDYSTGSGFVVTPDGAIVTASHVVEPEEQDLRQYAANMLFFDDLAKPLDLPPLAEDENPYTRFQLRDNEEMTELLHQCYDGVACEFDVRTSHTVYSGVQLAGAAVPKGMPARVLTSTGFDNTDVAVLKVDGQGMPTAALGDTAKELQSGDDVAALGFPSSATRLPQGETEPTKAFGKVSNVRSVGSSREVEVDMRVEGGMSGGPVLDEAGKVVGLVSYTRLRNDCSDAQHYVRTVDDIRTTLTQAGVQPSRGQVDEAFTKGMELFWGRRYSAALPLLQQAANLHDGHPLAKTYAASAQAKAGTPEDVKVGDATGAAGAPAGDTPTEGTGGSRSRSSAGSTSSAEQGSPLPLLAGLGVAGLAAAGLAAATGVMVVRRRSRSGSSYPSPAPAQPGHDAASPAFYAAPAPTPAPVPAGAGVPTTAPAPGATLGFVSYPVAPSGGCLACSAPMTPGSRFCSSCGHSAR